ncbi:MAG: 2-C-methyl-D-erythritol 4-phosphate cytidylyltransferase [Verrucomicrobiota bacterium]
MGAFVGLAPSALRGGVGAVKNGGGMSHLMSMDPARPTPRCTAILVGAGSSRRMGMDKLAWSLDGIPVLRRSLEAFLAADSICAVVVVCPPARWKLFDGREFSKPVMRVDGGESRQDSVMRGLAALDGQSGWVAVHDGARPLIAPDDIDRCVAAAIEHRAAALARRVTETMQRSDDGDFSAMPVARDHLWCMETPQVFEAAMLRDAYALVTERGLIVTDEVCALQTFGVPVKFVASQHPNLKITTPADLVLAESLLRCRPASVATPEIQIITP